MNMIICGNFGKENQCGTCKKFWMWGISTGCCGADDENNKDMGSMSFCDCGKYEKGKPISD